VRRWDVASGSATDTYNGSKAVTCLASPEGGASLVAFGSSDRVLRIWDSRAKGEALAVKSYASHEGWVSCIAWCAGSPHQLVTGSHDASIKAWDVRTAVPLGTVRQHADKVLCAAWRSAGSIVSGGADCTLRTYEVPGLA
jgi:ribosome biogenesis protein YTM1